MKTITITILGGAIAGCSLPKDTRVIIKDYDVEDDSLPNIRKDKNGQPFHRIEYINKKKS